MNKLFDEGGELISFAGIFGTFYVSTQMLKSVQPITRPPKIGRNKKCPCGSGFKHKQCCGKP